MSVTQWAAISGTSPAAPFQAPSAVLDDGDYGRFHARAERYDRENEFFAEDFDDLRAAGYLRLALPESLGGSGLSLAQVAREQRRLAYWAPATAVAMTMHLYWIGPAVTLRSRGDRTLDWLLSEVGSGAVVAAGHGERGNDAGLDDSSTSAVPLADGGYAFTGRKTFTSMTPVWTKLGLHARDESDPQRPKIVHAFIDRDAAGVSTERTWDALGLRATRSDDTVLVDVVAPPHQVVAIIPIGEPYPPYINGILHWYLPLLGSAYFGIARRALDVAIAASRERPSMVLNGDTHAHKAAVQRQVAEAEVALEAAWAALEKTADDVDAGVDHGAWWIPRLFAVKELATSTARRVVDIAVQIVGAASVSRSNELERLYRDVRTGTLHPPNSDAALDVIGRSALGLFP